MAKRRKKSKKPTSAAKACVTQEISKHCAKKARKCKNPRKRKQAVAISFAICRRKGYRSIPATPR